MKIYLALFYLFALCSCVEKKPALPTPPPVKAFVEVDVKAPWLSRFSLHSLSLKQQQEFAQLLQEEVCPCNCPKSFAGCLDEKSQCGPAVILAQWIIQYLQAGMSSFVLAKQVTEEINAGFNMAPEIIDLAGYEAMGAAGSAYTIVEFADFECTHCKAAAAALKELVRQHPKQVKLVYKHFPLSGHKMAKEGAAAVEAAGKQGKFWQMHEALFALSGRLTEETLQQSAKKIGLNLTRFNQDRTSKAILDKVESSLKEAKALGLSGTPSLFFNGRPYHLWPDLPSLKARLAMEEARGSARCGP